MEVIVSPGAAADLDDIWDYSAARWSEDQAEQYIRQVWSAVEAVAADPRKARKCDDIRPGYRRYEVGSHILFVRIIENRLEVIRILHQRMDVDQHL